MAEPLPGLWSRLLAGAGALALALPRPLWALVAVGWAGFGWFLSSRPGEDLPSSFLWSWAGNLAHAPLFGLLALWLALAAPRRPASGERGPWARLARRDRLTILALVLAWSLTDEWHQSWVAGRDASVFDLVTDLVGAAVTLDVARAAGDPAATEAGLRRRMARGVLLCLGAALAATL